MTLNLSLKKLSAQQCQVGWITGIAAHYTAIPIGAATSDASVTGTSGIYVKQLEICKSDAL